MSDVEKFHWIDEEEERYLADSQTSAWESAWPEYLGRYLDHCWSGWERESDEVKSEWLRDRAQTVALGWTSAEQRAQLDSLSSERGDWREWLPVQLDEWWPDWAKASPAELTAWFDGALPGLFPEQPAAASEPAADPRDLTWLTPDQQAHLDTLTETRGDWRTWLPPQMDEWWPEWTAADPTQLATWFNGALPGLTQQATAESPDVRDLAWLTPEQQAQLDELTPVRGDWHAWLPLQMDKWWADWTRSTAEQLTTWFDTALPTLVPADPKDPIGGVAEAQAAEGAMAEAEAGDTEEGVPANRPTVEDLLLDPDPAELDADPAEFDPRALLWLSAEQQSALDDLTEIRGDWHEWLIADLDRRRPDWTDLSEQQIGGWFDDLLPFLALPDAEQELMTVLDGLDSDEEFQLLASEFTPEELAEIVDEVFADAGDLN
ncbi:hypothetical protein [Kribbella monticola]|uniref:hypothetical protein n=1 Tax=Kribbella monticola TaxID=2185285 RepID=UPI000DD3810E|nr:hypothetical protein [Kribbella monticola]